MNKLKILRIGLFQMAAGGLSVVFLGIINRVMRVELGIDLAIVSLIVGGGHYMGALVAIPFGHFSDTHRIAGYSRTIYIFLGTIVTTTILVFAPHMAVWLSSDTTVLRIIITFMFFLLEGVSTFLAGTAYLALITDITTSKDRGSAAGLVWTLLMVGIIITGITAASYMENYSFNRIIILCSSASIITLLLALIALWNQEIRSNEKISQPESLRNAFKVLTSFKTTRKFALFLLIGLFSFFMQDVILEPFGGEVFNLSTSQTTRFNSFLGVGLVSAMLLGGTYLIPRIGKTRVTNIGGYIIAVSFAGLAISGFTRNGQALNIIIFFLGLGAGLFTVGSIALMFDLTAERHVGLYIGAWTLVQALAKGPAAIMSGVFHKMFTSLGLAAGEAYGSVFTLEAIGLLVAIYLLRKVNVQTFQEEIKLQWADESI